MTSGDSLYLEDNLWSVVRPTLSLDVNPGVYIHLVETSVLVVVVIADVEPCDSVDII